jgi:hypothetical protein
MLQAHAGDPAVRLLNAMNFIAGRLLFTLSLVAGLCAGCARYEYHLVHPNEFAQVITKQATRVEMPPLEYQIQERDRRLIVVVSNPGGQPVLVSGGQSYIVDPRGETRPLPAGSIAPKSYTSLMLPPAPPVYRASPSFSFGFGLGHTFYHGPHFGHGMYMGYGYDPFFYGGPTYIYPMNQPGYWDWKTGEVRVNLHILNPPGATTTNGIDHQFVFDRRRKTSK